MPIDDRMTVGEDFNFVEIKIGTSRLRMDRRYMIIKDELIRQTGAQDVGYIGKKKAASESTDASWWQKVKRFFTPKQVAADTEISV